MAQELEQAEQINEDGQWHSLIQHFEYFVANPKINGVIKGVADSGYEVVSDSNDRLARSIGDKVIKRMIDGRNFEK